MCLLGVRVCANGAQQLGGDTWPLGTSIQAAMIGFDNAQKRTVGTSTPLLNTSHMGKRGANDEPFLQRV